MEVISVRVSSGLGLDYSERLAQHPQGAPASPPPLSGRPRSSPSPRGRGPWPLPALALLSHPGCAGVIPRGQPQSPGLSDRGRGDAERRQSPAGCAQAPQAICARVPELPCRAVPCKQGVSAEGRLFPAQAPLRWGTGRGLHPAAVPAAVGGGAMPERAGA